ncbi:MAG: PqqD family protein [Clostridia bacterium]|nr:PqqD family protein [Clostridia bacterium]
MKVKSEFVLREVGGEKIVVPVGKTAAFFHGMITLNETGAFLWQFFTEEHTADDGANALCAEYEVDKKKARLHVDKFLSTLFDAGVLDE